MIWGGRYIKFIVGLNPTRLDSSVVRASGICPEGLGSIPSLVTFLYSNMLDFHNKVTTSETLISDYKVRSQVRNNVKSSLIMVYYLY